MIIFQKLNHSNPSAKMIIFQPILIPILLTCFQAPPQTFVYILTVTLQPFDVFSMAPKAKKSASAAAKPQSASAPNESESLLQRLQNLFSSTPLMKRMPPHSPHQPRPAA